MNLGRHQHGIGAIPSEGMRFWATSKLVTRGNYTTIEKELAHGIFQATNSSFNGGAKAKIRMNIPFSFGEVCASLASSINSKTWLCDSGASHHICRDKSMFTELRPFKGKFTILQASGELEITHWGTICVEVDGKFGKKWMLLGNVLLLDCMMFNIFSLQKARQNKFYYGFDDVPGKISLLRRVEDGVVYQLALMTEENGRWTLDCKVVQHRLPLPECRQPEVLANSLSMDEAGDAELGADLLEDAEEGVDLTGGEAARVDVQPVLRRSTRANKGVPLSYMANMLMLATMETSAEDAETYNQGMKRHDREKWLGACATQVESMEENNVYKAVDRPTNRPVITSKSDFKRKRGLSGVVEK